MNFIVEDGPYPHIVDRRTACPILCSPAHCSPTNEAGRKLILKVCELINCLPESEIPSIYANPASDGLRPPMWEQTGDFFKRIY